MNNLNRFDRLSHRTVIRSNVSYWLLFFFFQAEDGIRDADVTGVQTCALPISSLRIDPVYREPNSHPHLSEDERQRLIRSEIANIRKSYVDKNGNVQTEIIEYEIGRASCRERV